MRTPSSVPRDGAMPVLDEPRVRPVRGPPPGRSGESAEVTLRLTQERGRIAAGMNDIVVYRLFSAGLSLQTALGLMDGHPAAGKVQQAVDELDLAIADFRDVLFDHHQPG
jgi:Histidine kinase